MKKKIYTFEQLRREYDLDEFYKPNRYYDDNSLIWCDFSGQISSDMVDSYCNEFVWRVPTIKELLSMTNHKNKGSFWSSDFYNDSDRFSFSFWTGGVSWSKYPRFLTLVRNIGE